VYVYGRGASHRGSRHCTQNGPTCVRGSFCVQWRLPLRGRHCTHVGPFFVQWRLVLCTVYSGNSFCVQCTVATRFVSFCVQWRLPLRGPTCVFVREIVCTCVCAYACERSGVCMCVRTHRSVHTEVWGGFGW